MSIKISQLPPVTLLEDSAIIPLVQAGETQVATMTQIQDFISTTSKVTVNVSASAPGNLTVAHGLGATPNVAIIQMTSSGQIWLQSPIPYDSTNLYLTSSGGAVGNPLTGIAVVFV